MFTFPAYNTVHTTVKEHTDSPIDKELLMKREKERVALESYNQEMEARRIKAQKENEKALLEHAAFAQQGLRSNHLAALNYMDQHLPDQFLSEAFSYIYIKSLPHDNRYVHEHLNGFKDMGYMYIRKLGGMKYLKAQAEATNSIFLKKFYHAIDEVAKKASKKRTKKVLNTISDAEALDIVRGKISNSEQKELIKKIDSLGADELAELIKNKVVAVVRDEHQHEKDERDFRTILKDDLEDPELSPDTKELDSVDGGHIDTGDTMDDVDHVDDTSAENNQDEDKKKPKKSSFDPEKLKKNTEKKEDKKDKTEEKETDKDKPVTSLKKEDKKKETKTGLEGYDVSHLMRHWNPLTESFNYDENKQPKSLFYAMNVSIMRDMVKDAATESTDVSAKAPSQYVLENPLNLDIFNTYLKDNTSGIEDIALDATHEPKALGSTSIDPYEDVMTESVLQYTLLEAANTMRLITPTAKQIQEQSNYLLGIA